MVDRMIDAFSPCIARRNLRLGPELTLGDPSLPSDPPTPRTKIDPDQPIIGRTAKR